MCLNQKNQQKKILNDIWKSNENPTFKNPLPQSTIPGMNESHDIGSQTYISTGPGL